MKRTPIRKLTFAEKRERDRKRAEHVKAQRRLAGLPVAAVLDAVSGEAYLIGPNLPPPSAVTVSSTARRPGTAPSKSGDARSVAYLAWIRAQPCAVSGEAPPAIIEAHHVPPVGSAGVRCDFLTIPVTRKQHGRCQRYEVSREEQERILGETLIRFWTRAPAALKRRVLAEMLESLGGKGESR